MRPQSNPSTHRARWVSCAVLLAMMLAAPGAWAQSNDDYDVGSSPPQYMITLKGGMIHVPPFLLDSFYDEHTNTWGGDKQNYALGGEFVWRNLGEYELGFALEWADLRTEPGFWLEDGEPARTAQYTEVDLKLMSIIFSIYYYWEPTRWLSPYLGFGLGIGAVLGDIYKSDTVEGSACEQGLGGEPFAPESCYDAQGNPDPGQIDASSRMAEDGVLPVFPMLNLTAGLRFNIARYGVFKIEAGLHSYLYLGTAVGVQF